MLKPSQVKTNARNEWKTTVEEGNVQSKREIIKTKKFLQFQVHKYTLTCTSLLSKICVLSLNTRKELQQNKEERDFVKTIVIKILRI